MKSTICIAEDRGSFESAIKLLVFSLIKHNPEAEVGLFYPPANDDFVTWLETFPGVHLHRTGLRNGYGWNVKPQALMQLLDEGFEEVIWVDSDIIVNRNISPLFSGLASATFVVTEHTLAPERDDQNALRARLWGLPVGRILPHAISSGVVRATRAHYPLLERWWELLQTREYQEVQKLKWAQRPVHMLGDQDVLTAVLCSEEFSEIPLQVLRRGKHVIQFDGVYGYSVGERLRNLFGDGPSMTHSGATKPWSVQWLTPSLRDYIKMVYLDLSPYTLAALRLMHEVDCNRCWMEPHYRMSWIQRVLGLGHPALTGLPMAIFADLARIAKCLRQALAPNFQVLPNRSTYCTVAVRPVGAAGRDATEPVVKG
jgi:hypothetical protein